MSISSHRPTDRPRPATPRRRPSPTATAGLPATTSDDIADYERHRPYILGVLGRRCSWLDPAEREAVMHDAFVVLLEKARSGELDAAPMHAAQIRAYLTQTALNKALDIGKSAARQRTEPIEQSDGRQLDVVCDDAAIEDRVIAGDTGRQVRESMGSLPERQRATLTLRYLMDRHPDEVRRALGVSTRQYRRDLERGKRSLGACLRQARVVD